LGTQAIRPATSIEAKINGAAKAGAALPRTSDIVKCVAVAGATGRTGSLVAQELRRRGVNVVAVVRNEEKARKMLGSGVGTVNGAGAEDAELGALTVIQCDFVDEKGLQSAMDGCDAAIWCATGFSDAPGVPLIEKIQTILGMALAPRSSIDSVGVPAIAGAFECGGEGYSLPRVIMLSSAGVTRPSWNEKKKKMYNGCADIPIVRLNPFGILDVKAESEEILRNSGVNYCIFRPTGLNDNWPAGSRPIFSQGDVAVGRINRRDVATILVDCLTTPEATGKTFEAFTIDGYPPAGAINSALARLRMDEEGIPDETLAATYAMMQQLLPGEKQDASKLAMGQTYEELDKGEMGRLGPKGRENAEAVAPKPSS